MTARFALTGSYPVRAAAEATGVDYSLALQCVDAPTYWAAAQVVDHMLAIHPERSVEAFMAMIDDAHRAGIVRVRRHDQRGQIY